MKISLIICLLFSVKTFSQLYIDSEGVLRDSFYTVQGYYHKELKKFPFIKIAQVDAAKKVCADYNLVYKIIGNRKLKLDLFYPEIIKDKMPIVIFIHGGGWKSGEKSFLHPMAVEIANEGYLCVTVEYRLSPEAIFPAAVFDIKTAIKWIKINADNYNADSSKVNLVGCSSGGHLAALCGTTANNFLIDSEDSLKAVSPIVKTVINIDGILDFTHPAESGKDTNNTKPSVGKLWLGKSFKEDAQLWVDASPLKYISPSSPDFLFINSSNDRFHAGRDEAAKLFECFGIRYRIKTIPNTPHTFWLFEPWFVQTTQIITEFLSANR